MSQSNAQPVIRRAQLRLPPKLKADCANCSGLCCAVHPFYACQGFGFDKPAHIACQHLDERQRCAIHRQREALGFAGCMAFDCYGAGQRVTQELFPGVNWRASLQSASGMFAAYTILLVLHRLLAQLTLVAELSPAASREIETRREQLEQLCRSPAVADGRLTTVALERETLQFLRSQVQRTQPPSG